MYYRYTLLFHRYFSTYIDDSEKFVQYKKTMKYPAGFSIGGNHVLPIFQLLLNGVCLFDILFCSLQVII